VLLVVSRHSTGDLLDVYSPRLLLAPHATLTASTPLPPGPEPVGSLCRRLGFELRVIPRTTTLDEVEAGLANALVAMVGGNKLQVTPAQVLSYLDSIFGIASDTVQVMQSP
jgi:hypothetical protein